jgi:hypothetical protein
MALDIYNTYTGPKISKKKPKSDDLKIISYKIGEIQKDRIDLLIRAGHFTNYSDAMRTIIRAVNLMDQLGYNDFYVYKFNYKPQRERKIMTTFKIPVGFPMKTYELNRSLFLRLAIDFYLDVVMNYSRN